MKIIFMSGGDRATALQYLLDHGEQISAVVTPEPSSTNNRFKSVIDVAASNNIPHVTVSRETLLDKIQELQPDIIISCGFSLIMSKETISLARHAINVHPTLLPKYRGYRSGPYILINGEKESGVTVHLITPEMDRGDILVQKHFAVSPFDTPKSMKRKSDAAEGPALHEALQRLKSGNIKAEPQDESEASEYTKMRTPADSEIDPSQPLQDLYNQIRACDPNDYPAFFYVDGQKVCIRLWRPDKKDDDGDMI